MTEATPGDTLKETSDAVEMGGVPPPDPPVEPVPLPDPPAENVAWPPLPQAVNSARQDKTRIKDAVFTLVSIAPQKRVFR
jgi:hypothetical protein